MAEFAQQRLEEFGPILEEIKRIKLLPKQKIKEIAENINDHEYKIQSNSKSLDVVLNYVNFQISLLKEIQKNRKDLQLFIKSKEIDDAISYRINSLFGLHERNFADTPKYWQARLGFTIGQKWYEVTSKVYLSMCQRLGKVSPFLWREASDFEWSRNPFKGINPARKLLQLGIRDNCQNLDLYIWAFELELKHADWLLIRKENYKVLTSEAKVQECIEQAERCIASAKVVYKQAKDNCWKQDCTVKLYVMFQSVTAKYPRFEELNATLLKDLEANCSSEEETYHVLSMLAFNKNDEKTGTMMLQQGLQVLQTIKMYDIAVSNLLLWVQFKPTEEVFKQLRDILEEGHKNDKLSVDCYVKWMELGSTWEKHLLEKKLQVSISKKKSKIQEQVISSQEPDEDYFSTAKNKKIADWGMQKYPNHPSLVVAKAKALIVTQNWKPSEIMTLLSTIKQERAKDDVAYGELCEKLFLTSVCKMDPGSKSDNFIKTLIDTCLDQKVKDKLMSMYLKHLVLKRSIEAARLYFDKVKLHCGSYLVYKKMTDLELLNIDRSSDNPMQRIREIMDRACVLFGKQTADVWLDYIDIETRLKYLNEAARIRTRAESMLQGCILDEFIKKSRLHKKTTPDC